MRSVKQRDQDATTHPAPFPENKKGSGPSFFRVQDPARQSHRKPDDSNWIILRVKLQKSVLQEAHRSLLRMSGRNLISSYASEWILDNYHVIQQTIRQIQKELPNRFYRQLPKLAIGRLKDKPRVYAMALKAIHQSRGRLKEETFTDAVTTYQETTVLEIGEIWAYPTMLRAGVLEYLTPAVARVAGVRLPPELHPQRLPQAELLNDEKTVANAILGLRLLASHDWKAFFEHVSHVEAVLRLDPSNAYASMDFESRDRYRKAVEELARSSGAKEVDVALEAVRLAEEYRGKKDTNKGYNHVGYYLIRSGRALLEKRLDYTPSMWRRVRRWLLTRPTLIYLGGIGLLSLCVLLSLGAYAWASGGSFFAVVGTLFALLAPVTVFSATLANWGFSQLVRPRALPKMDFQEGIPDDCRTLVVVPAMLSAPETIKELLLQLEVHFLGNSDPNIAFALLTDFTDAPRKTMPEDQTLIDQAVAGIRELNGRHGRPESSEAYFRLPFYFFHRERLWNNQENAWMGWERKRGKLEEFNRLLLGEERASYMVQTGLLERLNTVRYVITLDADTILPRETAHRLIGTLAHPLNRAEIDPKTGEVVSGYTVIQPRTEIKPGTANRSIFTRVFSGDTGLDLYSPAVSDIYQDLFREGIYVGKGIYDVSAFQTILGQRVPENTLLSHDLFEGLHVRVGLATDIILLEEYPRSYLSYARRLHRWIRGDWQLLPWLLFRTPYEGDGKLTPLSFSIISRWKILDNLLRSLFTPALLVLFTAAWLWLPGSSLVWMGFAVLAPATHLFTYFITECIRQLGYSSDERTFPSMKLPVLRWLLMLVFLPYEAVLSIGAVAKTLFRLTITRAHLLEWMTSASSALLHGGELQPMNYWRRMIWAPLIAVGLTLAVSWHHPTAIFTALPLLLVWFLSPQIAWWVSQPPMSAEEPVLEGMRYVVRRLARRTWFYFEQFVGPEDYWLPPDHFQESPRGTSAHRTSPTNIGLMLLTTLGAYDLGYIGISGLSLRLRNAFETMGKLERHRGHFLNWYDTQSLTPLPERYVSTVDSGNLAAALLSLKEGVSDIADAPLMRWRDLQGLLDTLDVLDEVVESIDPGKTDAVVSLRRRWNEIREQTLAVRNDSSQWPALLLKLDRQDREDLDQSLRTMIRAKGRHLDASALNILRSWTERFHHQLRSMRRELKQLAPWVFLSPSGPPGLPINDTSVAAAWRNLMSVLSPNPHLTEIGFICSKAVNHLEQLKKAIEGRTLTKGLMESNLRWCERLKNQLNASRLAARALLEDYRMLGDKAEAYAMGMDFGFLMDAYRNLFHIGFNVDAGALDSNYYDLLASEARLASLFGIAKGDVFQRHWLYLSRPLTWTDGTRSLLSWSGSMFEYLMPTLLTSDPEYTLLGQSNRSAVLKQIDYGHQKGVPWGISESAYYGFDSHMNYQYRAFGVPGLGFKQGLEDDLVVAPYASLLALPLQPGKVMENIERLVERNMLGNYGFYESIDYTASRLPLGQDHAIVRSYYTHHQGMIFLSMTNYLLEGIMVKRFHRNPHIQSVELLLKEKSPNRSPAVLKLDRREMPAAQEEPVISSAPWKVSVSASYPHLHCLSNGSYSVFITSAGGGFSRWKEVDLTRWRADSTLDNWGAWIYIQDVETGNLWSPTLQPTAAPAIRQDVFFSPDKADFHCENHGIITRLEITTPPNDAVEIRRLTISNQGGRPRRLRITSYAEVVLTEQSTDRRHPAFNKLFIESEYLPDLNSLLFHRRSRSAEESPVYTMHGLVLPPGKKITGAHETDRGRFLGRLRTTRRPAALDPRSGRLSGTTGATLDPIMSLEQEIELRPNETDVLAYFTLAAPSREGALNLSAGYREWGGLDWAFEQRHIESELELRRLKITPGDLKATQELLSILFYPNGALRARTGILETNNKGQPGLWQYGISGDYPMLAIWIRKKKELPLLRRLLKAHHYWRNRKLQIDLLILYAEEVSNSSELEDSVRRMLSKTDNDVWLNRRGGIFLLNGRQIGDESLNLLLTASRVVLDGANGSLEEQLRAGRIQPVDLPPLIPTSSEPEDEKSASGLSRPTDLLFDNGMGGFTPDGREYVIFLEPDRYTPVPWINVIANPDFGFFVSESGSGNTWAVNSGENRLTPWQNDPVSDPPGEVVYLRDEETGIVWSPTPAPAGAAEPYLIRHGAGYSVFEHHSHGLKQSVCMFAASKNPMKFIRVRLENTFMNIRRLTITCYVEWVLGVDRDTMQQHVIPEYSEEHQALFARSPYNVEFGDRLAFLSADKTLHGLTGNRTEFLGRMGDYKHPAGLMRIGLAGTVRAGDDPCAAVQVHMNLNPGEAQEVCFLMGQGRDRQETVRLLKEFRKPDRIEKERQKVNALWDEILGAVQVETPDAGMNLLLNRWLLYQNLSCRLWGRSALYQSSGAFGFRDQLQDVMALVHTKPELVREHLLRAARHQFEEGDVLHWWHPPLGRGVRTRISDDLLWLPFVTAHYVETSGDYSILKEKAPFLKAPPLRVDEEERYDQFEAHGDEFTHYEHCLRAIEKASTKGSHGLPLFGAGDWNDGMNRVGIKGKGESVWLGWFLHAVLNDFADICMKQGDEKRAKDYRLRAGELKENLEAHGWDGRWYLRGYYDDGSLLGSSESKECQIDSVAQSWAVLSGAGDRSRTEMAMGAVFERLVQAEDGLIKLLTPPFAEFRRDPGYIRGYPAGIRENGGQYTHAALWVIWAFAEMGKGDLAERLFRILNPIHHSDTPEKVGLYKVEPYVVAADVYGVPPHTGRGGWTWYTGSGGWMYRVGLEAILGLRRNGAHLQLAPCIPKTWRKFNLLYRYGKTRYRISVENPDGVQNGVQEISMDGKTLSERKIPLFDDRREHIVLIRMGL